MLKLLTNQLAIIWGLPHTIFCGIMLLSLLLLHPLLLYAAAVILLLQTRVTSILNCT
jgi:hypothetical protein